MLSFFTNVNVPRAVVVATAIGSGALSFAMGGSGAEILLMSMMVPGAALTGNMLTNAIRKLKGERPLNLSASGIEVGDIETLAALLGGYGFSKGVLHEQSPVGVLKQTVAGPGLLLIAKTAYTLSRDVAPSNSSSDENGNNSVETKKKKRL